MCKSWKYGFTIVELLIVLAIIAIILTISIPAIANLTSPKYLLKKEGRRITNFMRQARTKAMNQKVPIDLWLDPAQNTIYAQEKSFSRLRREPEDENDEPQNHRFMQTLSLNENIVVQPLFAGEVSSLSKKDSLFETLDQPAEKIPALNNSSSEKIHILTFTHFGGSDGGGISISYKKIRLNIAADILCGNPKMMKHNNNE